MKKIKILGASFLALSSLLLSSYADGSGYSNDNQPYGSSSGSYSSSYNNPSSSYNNGNGSSYSSSYSNPNAPSYSGRSYNDSSMGSSSTYSGRNYNDTQSTSTYTMGNGNGNGKGRAGYAPTTGTCGTSFDMNLFEGQDEQDAYSAYGYTRGDIYYIYRYKFDPNTIVTADGTVEKVIRVQYPDGDCYLVLILSTQEGDLLVNLGPVNYFDSQRVIIEEGDSIQVRGSKIRLNGRFVLIGMDLNRDGKTIPLRNEAGQPAWKQGTTGAQTGMTNTNVQNPPRGADMSGSQFGGSQYGNGSSQYGNAPSQYNSSTSTQYGSSSSQYRSSSNY